MGKNSHIEWTHHTFNPWWGCVKVSPACENCYAEAWAKRVGEDVWGKGSSRRFFTDTHWKEPLKWHAEAVANGKRARVFCASMADVFEERKDLDSWRARLWELIVETPMLDWLLLTKRPQAVERLIPWGDDWPDNIWLGTTVENQKYAELRIPHLLANKAKIRFLSCEPLLGPLDLEPWLKGKDSPPISWIIAGGESGAKSRPMHPDWARNLRDTSERHGVAFHFKQWGHWVPAEMVQEQIRRSLSVTSGDGNTVTMLPLGKKDAGRFLDGRLYDGVPNLVA